MREREKRTMSSRIFDQNERGAQQAMRLTTSPTQKGKRAHSITYYYTQSTTLFIDPNPMTRRGFFFHSR